MRGGPTLVLIILFVGLVIQFVQNNYDWLVPIFILIIVFLALLVFGRGGKIEGDAVIKHHVTGRVFDSRKLTFSRSDDRSVLYDGRVIGHIVPVRSSIEPWAFVPTRNNGIIDFEFRRRAQKDIRAFLHARLGEIAAQSSPGVSYGHSQNEGTSHIGQERNLPKRIYRSNGGRVYSKSVTIETGFHRAVMGNDVTKIRKLIEAGVDRNVRGYNGSTALHIAARGGNLEMINALIEARVELNLRNHEGFTALDVARGSDVVAALIAAGGYRTRVWARTPRRPVKDSRND